VHSIDRFLAEIETRAFHMARIASGNEQDALDIVQDAMLKLVQRYAEKSPENWKPLFFRILQNRITDFHRRQTLGGRIFGWIKFKQDQDSDEEYLSPENSADPQALLPEQLLQQCRFSEALTEALKRLPQRQQQTFLLRIWEGLSVKETAIAMQCSEGSVKTHLSRAIQSLRNTLEPHDFSGTDHEN
jgi:RNA polymerase sigma-70 factor (ECF subfamily)